MTISDTLFPVYVDIFNRRGEQALKDFCNLQVPKKIILEKYNYTLPMPTKQLDELRLYAMEMFPNGDEKTINDFMKITYTIGMSL